MYSIIVLSHGDLANGLKDTMMMILGEQEDTYFISFTPSDSVEDFEKRVKVIFNSIDKENQVLILTDLYGGTPNHVATALKLEQPQRVEVVSGVNMPLLMTAVLSKSMNLSDSIDHIIAECHTGITKIEAVTENHEEDE